MFFAALAIAMIPILISIRLVYLKKGKDRSTLTRNPKVRCVGAEANASSAVAWQRSIASIDSFCLALQAVGLTAFAKVYG